MCKLRMSDDDYALICRTKPLTDTEKRILDMVRRGDSYLEVGEELGYCERSIARAVKRIRKYLETPESC